MNNNLDIFYSKQWAEDFSHIRCVQSTMILCNGFNGTPETFTTLTIIYNNKQLVVLQENRTAILSELIPDADYKYMLSIVADKFNCNIKEAKSILLK